ncbi:MAG: hypothetical protein M5U34_24915 [Chloroflexi bacterium]|nr:hypothetical protein [Chloroflexota bacterium]
MMQNKENLAPPPGIWPTIAAGFDLVTHHLWLLILPVCLDAFLWLGPRLSFRPIIEQMMALLPTDPALQEITAQILAFAPRTNLFTSLSVPLVGIPALMVGMTPESTPLPAPITELTDPLVWFGLFLLFSFIGIWLTALYYVFIAQAVRLESKQQPLTVGQLAGRFGQTGLKLMGLGVLFIILGFILYIPLLFMSVAAALFSQFLATMVLFAGPVLLLWFFIFVYFTPRLWRFMGCPCPRRCFTAPIWCAPFSGRFCCCCWPF